MNPVVIHVEVEIPELGLRGYSMFVTFSDDDAFWTIACSNRAIVTVPQKKVLMGRSYTENRGLDAAGIKAHFEKAGLSS